MSFVVGEDGKERHVNGIVWTLQVVKTNGTYRTGKVADSWIADGTFIMRSDFLMPLLSCKNYLGMTVKAGCAESREGQQEARLNPC